MGYGHDERRHLGELVRITSATFFESKEAAEPTKVKTVASRTVRVRMRTILATKSIADGS